MKYYTIQLLIVVFVSTATTIAMEKFRTTSDIDVCVFVKNLSTGLTGNTYDIYVQMVPTLYASRTMHKEILIPYGETKPIGMLYRINDIKTRGSSVISPWTYNKNILNEIKQELAKYKSAPGKNLQLLIAAGVTGFYISYYNWVNNSQ